MGSRVERLPGVRLQGVGATAWDSKGLRESRPARAGKGSRGRAAERPADGSETPGFLSEQSEPGCTIHVQRQEVAVCWGRTGGKLGVLVVRRKRSDESPGTETGQEGGSGVGRARFLQGRAPRQHECHAHCGGGKYESGNHGDVLNAGGQFWLCGEEL